MSELGRQSKFTPERIEQIKNLVERGLPREEIAAELGLTLGSLQVTCSRMGISLRRPRLDNGVSLSRPKPAKPKPVERPKPVEQPVTNGHDTVPEMHLELSLTLRNRHHERTLLLTIPQQVVLELALEAALRDSTIAAMVIERLSKTARP